MAAGVGAGRSGGSPICVEAGARAGWEMQWVLAASAPLAMWVCMAIGSSRVSWRIDSHVARGSARAAPACGEEDRDEKTPIERSDRVRIFMHK